VDNDLSYLHDCWIHLFAQRIHIHATHSGCLGIHSDCHSAVLVGVSNYRGYLDHETI